MTRVVFAAPFLMEATRRFVDAVAALPGVRLGLLTQEPLEKVPPDLRALLAAHWRIPDGLDPSGIEEGVRGLAGQMGGVDRLLGTLEQAQVPMAAARQHEPGWNEGRWDLAADCGLSGATECVIDSPCAHAECSSVVPMP